MMTTGSTIVQALERAWEDIRSNHPEVKPVTIITGSALTNGAWGHHWPDRWAEAEAQGRTPELFVAGELFGLGAKFVLQVMLHEAAHNLAYARDIKDTSRQGRYHNRKFAELATEMGMTPPEAPHKVHGFHQTSITEETEARYFSTLVELETSIKFALPDLGITPDTKEENEEGRPTIAPETGVKRRRRGDSDTSKRAGRRIGMSCACTPPRKIQITPRQMEVGPIICGVCKIEFLADA